MLLLLSLVFLLQFLFLSLFLRPLSRSHSTTKRSALGTHTHSRNYWFKYTHTHCRTQWGNEKTYPIIIYTYVYLNILLIFMSALSYNCIGSTNTHAHAGDALGRESPLLPLFIIPSRIQVENETKTNQKKEARKTRKHRRSEATQRFDDARRILAKISPIGGSRHWFAKRTIEIDRIICNNKHKKYPQRSCRQIASAGRQIDVYSILSMVP